MTEIESFYFFITLAGFLITPLGFIAAYVYGRKTTEFRWSEYFAMIALPLFAVVVNVAFGGIRILMFFIFSCLGGFSAEFMLGFAYHKILGRRLWTYKRLTFGYGYVSLLSLPFWGLAGFFFLSIFKVVEFLF